MSLIDENTDSDEVLVAALEALFDNDEEMSLRSLSRKVGQKLGRGEPNDEQRAEIERTLRRDGATFVRPPASAEEGWSLTVQGRGYIQRRSTEYEEQIVEQPHSFEAAVSVSAEDIISPFNPSHIRVDPEQMPVYHALDLIKKGRIDLDPDFQRNFIWDKTRQSRLIESILLRIPLPAFYFNATPESTYLVVDGRQRLSTLDAFCNKHELRLTGLEYLKELEDKTFTDLSLNWQTAITERTKLTVFTILPETPPQVKFMIFSRVNTGGLTLTAQEIRHALYQGNATHTLNTLATSVEFLEATAHSIRTLRMEDRECVLRFIAFHLNPYEEFGIRRTPDEPINLDGLLNRTMLQLNEQTPATTTDETMKIFRASMVKATTVFGANAFRKMYSRDERRKPVSKPLFEVWGVLLKEYELDALKRRRKAIVDGFIEVMTGDSDFETSISYGTGSPASVKYRFGRIRRLLQEVMQ